MLDKLDTADHKRSHNDLQGILDHSFHLSNQVDSGICQYTCRKILHYYRYTLCYNVGPIYHLDMYYCKTHLSSHVHICRDLLPNHILVCWMLYRDIAVDNWHQIDHLGTVHHSAALYIRVCIGIHQSRDYRKHRCGNGTHYYS